MDKTISIYFDSPKPFEPSDFLPLGGVAGLYFIFSKKTQIPYPFKSSRLLYIGMSEKKTNSIGGRLSNHHGGKSNVGLRNYKKVESLLFTHFNIDILQGVWEHQIEDLESYFIEQFTEIHGCHPICNNKTGAEIQSDRDTAKFNIDWNYFV